LRWPKENLEENLEHLDIAERPRRYECVQRFPIVDLWRPFATTNAAGASTVQPNWVTATRLRLSRLWPLPGRPGRGPAAPRLRYSQSI